MSTNEDVTSAELIPGKTVTWSRPARYMGLALFLLGIAAMLALLSPVGSTLVSAFLFAIILDIPARAISNRSRMRYPTAAMLSYLLIYVILAALLLIGFGIFAEATQSLGQALKEALPAILDQLGQAGAQTLAGLDRQALAKILEAAIKLVIGILALPTIIFANFAAAVVGFGFAIFLSNLIVLSGFQGRGFLSQWLPHAFHREGALLLTWLDGIWGRYLYGMLVFAIVLSAGSMVEFWLLGVPYPVILGILTGLISLIPFVGGILSDIVVAVPCLLLGSSRFPDLAPAVFALMVALINGVITTVTYNFIALPIIGRLVRLPFWVVLTGVMLGAALNSILFAFLVIPLFSTIRFLGGYLLSKILEKEPFPDQEEPTRAGGFFSQMLLGDGSTES